MDNKPWWLVSVAPLLAIIIVVGGFLVIVYAPSAKTETVGMMMLVLGFYFGSSQGSQNKSETIAKQLTGGKDGPSTG